MLNSEVSANLKRLRSCRYTFRACFCGSLLLSALCLFFFLPILKESGFEAGNAKTAFVLILNLIWFLIFLWSTHIFIREDRLLEDLVLEVEADGPKLIVTTIFSNRLSLQQPVLIVDSPKWIHQRKIWPIYFLKGTDSIQYFRQASKIVKCVAIEDGDLRFYWICTDTDVILKYVSSQQPST